MKIGKCRSEVEKHLVEQHKTLGFGVYLTGKIAKQHPKVLFSNLEKLRPVDVAVLRSRAWEWQEHTPKRSSVQ
jgi:hypothetical protein